MIDNDRRKLSFLRKIQGMKHMIDHDENNSSISEDLQLNAMK